ncbi:helix-turn-helix domain-containing protein [Phycicoccus flavus]|uniref:helix-turn-helix domain-containing protein n=1 Tax=Phycicoccus flavus TaxID=2502783 RepID=UPI000FEB6399|nr:TetR/AcrR family transcriptional regulator [Phycicoccus flavus]NHA68129.1 TetR/AcrR family transcriptional regulator [Phycicoccus flavus]
MGRWAPDARGRLVRAALVLGAEQGWDATTVGEIAAMAGVTERTFYRHFRDKADVLFPDNGDLLAMLAQTTRDARADGAAPADAALAAVRALAALVMEEPERIGLSARVVPTSPVLAGRDLYRQGQIVDAVTGALVEHGVAEREARLAAEGALAVWRVALREWSQAPDERPLTDVVASLEDHARTG